MRLSYNYDSDILIMNRLEGDPSERLMVGDILLDLNTSGDIRGLEICKASKFFNACKKELMNAKDADFYPTRKTLMLELTLKTKTNKKPSRIAVPIELP